MTFFLKIWKLIKNYVIASRKRFSCAPAPIEMRGGNLQLNGIPLPSPYKMTTYAGFSELSFEAQINPSAHI
jgi:hypothetical protein